MHGEVKGWVVILNRTKKLIHTNLCRKFFTNFALQRLFWCFPSLHLSARKLPPVFEIAIPSLCGEYLITLANNRCYYFYLFHYPTAIFWALSKIKPGM